MPCRPRFGLERIGQNDADSQRSSGRQGIVRVVVTKNFAKLSAISGKLVVSGAIASMLLAAHPALANSAVDMPSALRADKDAGQSPASGQDEQFSHLFSTWQNYEETGLIAAKPKADTTSLGMMGRVAIPTLVPVAYTRESSPFGEREHPVLGRMMMHKGLDLAAPTGTPVHATADGVVGRAQWVNGYGLYVQLEHGADLETRYGHLSRINVADGQVVHKGDVIGYVGATGRATGPHLHYEVRIDGVAVDPTPYMQTSFAKYEATEAEDEALGG